MNHYSRKSNRKTTNYMETTGILSLSLLLTSAFSISGCLPEMLEHFKGHTRSEVELLISIPAMAMVIMIALSPFLSRKAGERTIISSGLLLIGISGAVSFCFPLYRVILAARVLLGIGLGLVNTRAVSLIGERFSGDQKARLLGVRNSMETLGQAVLTFLAGQLILLGWNYAFLIYEPAFIVLLIYLAFVPSRGKREGGMRKQETIPVRSLGRAEWIRVLGAVLLGMLLISATVVKSLRIPALIVQLQLGSASDGATVLSISIFSGFLGGLFYGRIRRWWKRYTLPLTIFLTAAGMLIVYFASRLALVALGAIVCDFFLSIGVASVFQGVSERIPRENLDTANAAVLIGCNLGSSLTPFCLQLIDRVNSSIGAGFLAYATVLLAVGVCLCRAYAVDR